MGDIVTTSSRIVAAETAGTAETLYIPAPYQGGEWNLIGFIYAASASAAQHATNYATITPTRVADAVCAAQSTVTGATGVAYTAGTLAIFVIDASFQSFGPTDSVKVVIAKPGAGVALKGAFYCTWRKAQPD